MFVLKSPLLKPKPLKRFLPFFHIRPFSSASNKLKEPIILNSLLLNLKHKKWNFFKQNSSVLTDSLTRKVILHPQITPHLALSFFNWVSKNKSPLLSTETHLCTVCILVTAKLFDDAVTILKQLIKHEGVCHLANSFSKMDLDVAVYDASIRACTQLGLTKDAIFLIQTLKKINICVSIHAWNNLLNQVLVSEQDVNRFRTLYKNMLSSGYFENVNTFNLLIYSFCYEGRVWEGFTVLYRIIKLGYLPNIVTFNMLIDGCFHCKEHELALKLVDKIGDILGENEKPNHVTYNVVVHHLCKIGKVEVAKRFIKSHAPDIRTYAILIDGYGREGKLDDALKLFIEMTVEGFKPNVVVYNTLMNWLFKNGCIEEVKFLFKDMIESHVYPDHFTYSVLVDGFSRNGYMQEAIKYYHEAREEGLLKDASTFNSLIDCLCESGKMKEAQQLLCNMIVIGLSPDVYTYSTLIKRLCNESRIDEALDTYDIMVKKGERPNLVTYNSIIHGLCKVESVDIARIVVKEMRGANLNIDAITFNTLLSGYCREKNYKDAFALCREMRKLGVKENEVTYNVLISYMCKAKRFHEARETLKEMFVRDIIPDKITYTTLITAFSKNFSADEVVELHDFMVLRGVECDEYTYNSFVRVHVQNGDGSC